MSDCCESSAEGRAVPAPAHLPASTEVTLSPLPWEQSFQPSSWMSPQASFRPGCISVCEEIQECCSLARLVLREVRDVPLWIHPMAAPQAGNQLEPASIPQRSPAACRRRGRVQGPRAAHARKLGNIKPNKDLRLTLQE